MAEIELIKISELPATSTIGDADELAVVQDGASKKVPYSVVKAGAEVTPDTTLSEAGVPADAAAVGAALALKANQAAVTQALATKADNTTVSGISGDIEELASVVETKADQTALNQKADKTTTDTLRQDLTTLNGIVNQKADKTELNTQIGNVTAELATKANTADVNNLLAAKANIASPVFTGRPQAPTAPKGTATLQLATTAFVQNAIDDKEDKLTFDQAPTQGSTNPVTSGGVWEATQTDKTLAVEDKAADAKATGEKIAELKSSVNGTGLQSYMKIAEYPILPFEIGAIQITNDGWDYQENDRRIRTPQGQEIWLNAGDIIALTDYTNARFYLGVRRADGTYAAASWKTVDFTVTIPGWYVMLVARRTGETAITNVEELATLVRITRIKTTQNTVDDMQNALGYAQYAFDAYPIHGINHRGMQYEAPENTLPAFRLSVTARYKFVETDIQFTSDNIPVLLHDTTLNRTARNSDGSELASTINIADITYVQALEYVFPMVNGVYDASFLTNKIMSFEEFIIFCKRTEIFPYLELKLEATYTQAQVNILIDILTKYNMLRNVSWISWSDDWLRMIVNADKGARIGRIKNSEISGNAAAALNTFKTGYNRVFWSITPYTNDWTITEASFTRAMANDQGISIGVISTKDGMDNVLDHFANSGYISGCLSNARVNFADVVKNRALGV